MRKHLIVVALLAAPALADRPDKDKPIDISDAIDKVDVFRDDVGKFYVIPKFTRHGFPELSKKYTFFGDGRTMYLQRVDSSSVLQGLVSMGIWAPRVRGLENASIDVKPDGETTLTCNLRKHKYEKKGLSKLDDTDAKKLLASAKFVPPLWERQVKFFGRGESTTYYLLDMLRDEYGGTGYRLFIGRKGQMKPLAITDHADDNSGTLIVTKTGTLAIKKDAATWKSGKTTIDIITLPVTSNRYLVYRELGVYGQLGTVCEDQ